MAMPTAKISGKTARVWLDDVLTMFPDSGIGLESLRLIPGGVVPQPYNDLLGHEHHMTVTLERHHETHVVLESRAVRHEGDDYARKLLLRAGSADGKIVMAGIMRIQLGEVTEKVREQIVRAETPLGRILIENDVMRRIETKAFLRVILRNTLADVFSPEDGAEFTYGRIAVIFCDGKPAIELLEIVPPEAGTDK